MSNDKMRPLRFQIWHEARRKIAWIKSHLQAGHTVVMCTCTKATRYSIKHIDMFKACRSGPYVQRGKNWDHIGFTQFIVEE